MTALVVEGVTLQDLDELDEVTCCADDDPAVAVLRHGACQSLICAVHEKGTRRVLAQSIAKGWATQCTECGAQPVRPQDFEIRPL
jgi:hypothetical protein